MKLLHRRNCHAGLWHSCWLLLGWSCDADRSRYSFSIATVAVVPTCVPLVRQPSLAVMPLTAEQFQINVEAKE